MSTKQELELENEILQSQVKTLTVQLAEMTSARDYFKRDSEKLWKMYVDDTKTLDQKVAKTREEAKKIATDLVTEATRFVSDMSMQHQQELSLKIEQARTDTIADCFAHVTNLLATRG
jgi:F0F1-type ATP synthase membrane subunit b/b'